MTPTDKNRPLYMISVAASLAGLHPQTLRMYEARGLVTPKRTSGNTRMYSQADIERLELIAQLSKEGINLAGVVRILDQQQRMVSIQQSLEETRRELGYVHARLHELEMRQAITTLLRREHTGTLLQAADD